MADNETSLDPKQSIVSLESELSEIRIQIKRGKNALKLIDEYTAIFANLKSRATDEKTGLNAILASSKALRLQIYNDSIQVRKIVDKSSQDTIQLKKYLENFTLLKGKLDDKETGLQSTLKNVTTTNSSLRAANAECERRLKKISEHVKTSELYLLRINKSYKDFVDLKKKLEDPNSGLKATLKRSKATFDEIAAAKNQTDTIFTEVSRIKDDSSKFLANIENIEKSSIELNATILRLEQESQESKERIEQIYKLATDTGLANSFQARKRELRLGMWIWLVLLIVSASSLMGALFMIHKDSLKDGVKIDTLFWYRLTFTLPLIFLTIFSTSQYSKERGLLEKYAFKAATALALDSYTTLLTTKFSHAKDEILKFVLSSMTVIYKEPWEDAKESSFKMSIGNKIAEASAEIKETVRENVSKGFNKVEKVVEEQIQSIKEPDTVQANETEAV